MNEHRYEAIDTRTLEIYALAETPTETAREAIKCVADLFPPHKVADVLARTKVCNTATGEGVHVDWNTVEQKGHAMKRPQFTLDKVFPYGEPRRKPAKKVALISRSFDSPDKGEIDPWRKAIDIKALKAWFCDLSGRDPKNVTIRWDWKAGCSCECSPAFTVRDAKETESQLVCYDIL